MSERKPVRHFRFSKKGREIVRRNRMRSGQKANFSMPHRQLRLPFLIGIPVLVLVIVLALTVPGAVTSSRLKKLGYDKETITAIRQEKLTNTILDHGWYSPYLAQSIKDKTLNKDYMELYTVVPSDYGLDDTSFLLYQRLADKGYESDQLLNLFSKLDDYELIPLLVLDYQWDESQYIEECTAHHSDNSISSFTLDSSFLTPYKITAKAYNPDSTDVLVNSRYGLDSSYVPELTQVSTQYASNGVQLTAEAAHAFEQMSQASVEAGNNFFASDGYRSYEGQNTVYQGCLTSMDADTADKNCQRAGHNEQQTGLSVTVAPTYESYDNFEDSKVYQWLNENAASYGFIQRYPQALSSLTGVSNAAARYRYVGTDLAQRIKDSGMCFDEYYCLYLKPWNDKSLVPSDSVLSSTGAVSDVSEEEAE